MRIKTKCSIVSLTLRQNIQQKQNSRVATTLPQVPKTSGIFLRDSTTKQFGTAYAVYNLVLGSSDANQNSSG